MKTVEIYFYVNFFRANKKFLHDTNQNILYSIYLLQTTKKDSQFLGSLKLQLVAAHGFEPRTLRV